MALRDSMRDSAAPYLHPDEPIQAVFGAQTASQYLAMLTGVFVGRWLDQTFNSGLFWTAPLLMLGLALGCWSAWKWIKSA